MRWYYGPWVWDESRWRAPRGCTGLDLRTLPEQGQQGGSPGLSLFAGTLAENAADYTFMGEGDWSEVKPNAKQRQAIGHATAGDTLADIILSILSDRSDPDGLDAPRPLMPSTSGGLDLHCAGMSSKRAYQWGQRHTNKIRDVLRKDFADAWEANPTHARKVLDFWRAKHGADWRQFVPPALLPHVPGPLKHETTITDTFDRADGPIGNSSEGWAWSNVAGTWTIYSNAAGASAGFGWLACRAQSDLSSADQYSQVVIGTTKEYYGPAVRMGASSPVTFYQFSADTTRYLFKLVGGAQTVIASTAGTQVSGQTWKIEANGSTIKGYVNAAEILSVTDTSISSGVRTGIAGNQFSGYGNFTSFEAADLLPPAPVNTVAPAITPTSGEVGDEFTCSEGTWDNTPTGFAYQWKLDGSNVGTDANTYTPVAAGSLTCEVTASNAGGSTPATSNSATVSTGVMAPVASFVFGPTEGPAPLTVAFTDTSTNTPTSWLWQKSQNAAEWITFSTSQNPSYAFPAGTWYVRLTARNSAGASSYTVGGIRAAAPSLPASAFGFSGF